MNAMRSGIMLMATVAVGLSQTAPTAFEVASVKPAAPLPTSGGMRPTGGGPPGFNDSGRINYLNISLHTLLTRAYGVKDYQISGPGWLDSERFDIVAKIPPGTSKELVPLMLQTLLADRFKLRLHREEKELPIYALVVGQNGLKLKESQGDGEANFSVSAGRIRMSATSESLSRFADFLARQVDRPVRDMTELKGSYDVAMEWAPDGQGTFGRLGGAIPLSDGATPVSDGAAPSIFTALQEQLGLRLEPRRGSVELLVIDHVEKVPTEN